MEKFTLIFLSSFNNFFFWVHHTSSSTFHWLLYVLKHNVSHRIQINEPCFHHWSELWTSLQAAFWFFLLMRGSGLSVQRLETICQERSLPCSAPNWRAIPAAMLNQLLTEILCIILSSCAFVLWMPSLLAGLEWVCDIVKMQYSRNLRFGKTNFSCYGCYWPSSGQPAVGGFQTL